MSTKKEKCNGTKAEWLLEFENMVKDNSFVTPSSHLNVLAIQDFISKAITTAVAKDRELGNPYNSVSTWKEIGKNRGYWGFFKDQVISAREKELVEEVEKMKTYTGGSSVNEKDRRVNKQEVLSIINK